MALVATITNTAPNPDQVIATVSRPNSEGPRVLSAFGSAQAFLEFSLRAGYAEVRRRNAEAAEAAAVAAIAAAQQQLQAARQTEATNYASEVPEIP